MFVLGFGFGFVFVFVFGFGFGFVFVFAFVGTIVIRDLRDARKQPGQTIVGWRNGLASQSQREQKP